MGSRKNFGVKRCLVQKIVGSDICHIDLYHIPTIKVELKSDMQCVKGPNLEWPTVAWPNVSLTIVVQMELTL